MSSEYRPLLPKTPPSSTEDASGSQSQYPPSDLVKIPRTGTRVACEACRKKKTRCNGDRPVCNRCVNANTECIYRVDEEENEMSALKWRINKVIVELEQLRKLYDKIHLRSTEEAQAIFNHIRMNNDPTEVLRMVEASDILLQGNSPEERGMENQARQERTAK